MVDVLAKGVYLVRTDESYPGNVGCISSDKGVVGFIHAVLQGLKEHKHIGFLRDHPKMHGLKAKAEGYACADFTQELISNYEASHPEYTKVDDQEFKHFGQLLVVNKGVYKYSGGGEGPSYIDVVPSVTHIRSLLQIVQMVQKRDFDYIATRAMGGVSLAVAIGKEQLRNVLVLDKEVDDIEPAMLWSKTVLFVDDYTGTGSTIMKFASEVGLSLDQLELFTVGCSEEYFNNQCVNTKSLFVYNSLTQEVNFV